MTRRTRTRLMKITVIVAFAAFAAILIALSSAAAQSRFVERRAGDAYVFIDKYIASDRRDEFAAGLGSATGFLAEAGLADSLPERGPVAYFAADRHYGVVSANDPLVAKRLRGRPSSDFTLFRSIGTNFYANELVVRSVASQDGAYVFINLDDDWRGAALHAYAHAVGVANTPEAVRAALGVDQAASPEARAAFRFVDEVFALLSSDLQSLAAERGGLEAAWSAYPTESGRRYLDPSSELRAREAEILAATYDFPQRSTEFYAACNGFARWYLERHGKDALLRESRNFYEGSYERLEELFKDSGGLYAALEAWKGDASVPR